MDLVCFCSVLCSLCLCARLFICALWSPAGKGLTIWLSFFGIAIYRKEGSFRGRKVPSAEGRFLYGRKLLNKFISKIIL